jgi:hypothetical protein
MPASSTGPVVPVGVLLCSVFWILIGTDLLLLSSTSWSSSFLMTVPLIVGIVLVLVGFNLLQLQNWARISAIVFAVLGILYSATSFFALVYEIPSGIMDPFTMLRVGLFFVFIVMIWYCMRLKPLYSKREQETPVLSQDF